MKKIFQLTLILLSALVLSACSLQSNKSNQDNNSQNTSTETKTFSLRDLISQNIPQKCTWTADENGYQNTAEIIVKGNNFKQTIVSNNQEQGKMIINSISDGQYIYTWSQDESGAKTFAMKMKVDDTKTKDDTSQPVSGDIDFDEQHQLSCSPTTVSDSDFTPPANIEFDDYSQFLDQIKSSIPSIPVTESE